jgi:hypothetical protein
MKEIILQLFPILIIKLIFLLKSFRFLIFNVIFNKEQ